MTDWDDIKKRKINFKQRQEERDLIFIFTILGFWTVLIIAIYDEYIDETIIGWVVYIIIAVILVLRIPLIIIYLRNWLRYGSTKFQKMAMSEMSHIFILFILIAVYSFPSKVGFCFLILFLFIITMIDPDIEIRKVRPKFIYSMIIASAERVTHEYQNGYSQRPVEVRIADYDREEMVGQYIRFLLDNLLIWRVREDNRHIRLFFLPRGLTLFSFAIFQQTSHITIHDDGRAEVFICKQDYQFLKEPISYHLLCQRIGEKMSLAYELIADGKEKEARDVFTLKLRRKKKTRSRKTGSKRSPEGQKIGEDNGGERE